MGDAGGGWTGIGWLGGGAAALAVAVLAGGGMLVLRWDEPVWAGGHLVLALLFGVACASTLLRGRRHADWDPVEPTRLFFTVWFGTLALGFLRLSMFERPYSLRLILLLATGLGGFWLGARLAYAIWTPQRWRSLRDLRVLVHPEWDPELSYRLLQALFVVAAGAFAFTVYRFGAFPILSGNIEWARNSVAVNSYVQRLLLSLYVVAPLAVAHWLKFRRYTVPLAAMVALSLAAFFLLASSYFILNIIIVAFVLYRFTVPMLNWRRLAAIMLILLAGKLAVDTFRFVRSGYFANLTAGQDFPALLQPFEGDYFYVVMNLQVLGRLAEATPALFPYQHGYYLSYPVRALFESGESGRGKGKLSDALWEPTAEWFGFSTVTATCFGEPLEDFGWVGVGAWSLLFGFLAATSYARLRTRPTWMCVFVVAQFTLAITVSFFANIFALFDVYWALGLVLGFNALCYRHALVLGSDKAYARKVAGLEARA